MHAPLVAAVAMSLSPSPGELLAAEADLHAPLDAPAFLEPSPRAKFAMLLAMVESGVLDRDARDFHWFSAGIPWHSELRFAREIAAKIKAAPIIPDTYPPAAWFRWQARELSVVAAAYRKQAEEHRERVVWEADRAEALHDRARAFDSEAERLECLAAAYTLWGGSSWSRPRRLVVQDLAAAGWR